jgi:large conductance mechanosensitive channel
VTFEVGQSAVAAEAFADRRQDGQGSRPAGRAPRASNPNTDMEAAMIKEFKEFIAQGSAFELAVGIIIGVAFGAVVTSLVDDVIMQLISAILGQPSFNAISIHWGKELADPSSVIDKYPGLKHAYENQIFIGSLITKIVNFLIVGLVLFFLVKAINKLKRPQEVVVVAAGPSEVDLLTEIRDSLRAR